jgi:two-component system, chemotaxis family, response regulator Rcp1
MTHLTTLSPIDILLVEDSRSDATLTIRNLENNELINHIHWVEDGETAMAFLQRSGEYRQSLRPGLILLDLNLPGMDGREVLQAIKTNPQFQQIPVIILTTSGNQTDIDFAYQMNANCYVTKPVDLQQFIQVIQYISTFWLTVAQLPK